MGVPMLLLLPMLPLLLHPLHCFILLLLAAGQNVVALTPHRSQAPLLRRLRTLQRHLLQATKKTRGGCLEQTCHDGRSSSKQAAAGSTGASRQQPMAALVSACLLARCGAAVKLGAAGEGTL